MNYRETRIPRKADQTGELVQFEILDCVGLLDAGNAGALARKALVGALKIFQTFNNSDGNAFALRAQCGRGRPRSQ